MTHRTHHEALRERVEEFNATFIKAANARIKAYEARFKAEEVVTESDVVFNRVIIAENKTKEEQAQAIKDQVSAYRAYHMSCEACNAASTHCSEAYRNLLEIKSKAGYMHLNGREI